MEKSESESDLFLIDFSREVDRAYRLCSLVFRKTVIVHGDTLTLHPVENDILLRFGERTAPMYKIVLRHRHPVVKHDFLDLCEVDRTDFRVDLQSFHYRLDVICTIAGIDILHHDLAGHRHLGIERNLRISRVTAQASSVIKNLQDLLIQRQIGRRNAVHGPVDHNHSSGRHQQHDCTPSYQFLHTQ